MKRIILVGLFLALCGLPAAAQEHSKGEFFGGYQYTHLGPNFNGSGWNASVAGNLNRWFGVAADFSGAYDSRVHFHTYMFGPVVSYRKSDKLTPFAHVLLGGARISTGRISNSDFSAAFGGGFDTRLTDRISYRLIQGDWIVTRFGGIAATRNARFSTGIIFRF